MAGHETPDAADRRELVLASGEQSARWRTRFAGLFLFLPLLARLGFSKIVDRAGYPGTKRVPADAALLSLLTWRLLDKERHSHIDDFNFEEARGLFAGLNVLPKKSFASVQTFFAQEHEKQVLCYANANLMRDEQSGEVLVFADFWKDLTGHYPEWLYFDSRLTTYAELSRLNERGI